MKWFWQRKKNAPIQAYEGKNVFLLEDEESPYESILIRAVVEKGCLMVVDAELDHEPDGGWSRMVYMFDAPNTKKLFALLMKQGNDPYAVMGGMIDRDKRMQGVCDLCKENGIVYKQTLFY